MTSEPFWNRAALAPARSASWPRAEIAALPADRLPELGELFTFMRDAELRFSTLRLRIEERAGTTRGEHLVTSELLLRHAGDARVTTTEEHRGTAGNYDLWLSDGETVRTYSAQHKLGTQRPVRRCSGTRRCSPTHRTTSRSARSVNSCGRRSPLSIRRSLTAARGR